MGLQWKPLPLMLRFARTRKPSSNSITVIPSPDGTISYDKVIETIIAGIPTNFAISQNYPNPFNPSTKINYQIPTDARVILDVYNIAGQKVAELVIQNQAAGYYTVDFGTTGKLASGIYISNDSKQ